MNDYLMGILLGYFKAGLIAWIVWLVASIFYICGSFGMDPKKCREANSRLPEKNGKFSLLLISRRFILWPYDIFVCSNRLVKLVENVLSGKELKNGI